MNSKIVSTGSYLPHKILTNDDLSKMVDTTDEWITERTGIKKRHIVAVGELTSDLAFKASEEAIKNAGIDRSEIDMIVVATTTPDRTFPSVATILQNKLEIGEKCFAFDVQAVCSGFVYAITVADKFIKSGQVKTALVVGADSLSKIIDWTDRSTCVLFGDGAGAVILKREENKEKGILSSTLHSDGKYGKLLQTTGGASLNQKVGHIYMEGREVFKVAVKKMSESVIEGLEKAGLDINDMDLLVPHQANQRILTMVARKLKISEDKVVSTIEEHSNTSAATIPLALDVAVKSGRIKDGDVVVLEALGGGFTWGSVVMRW